MRVFVSRFKDTHAHRRRVLKRAAARGEVHLVERTRDGWLYEVSPDVKKALDL